MLEIKDLVFEVPVSGSSSVSAEDEPRSTKRIIDGLSLSIADDRFTVITGPNGGGKSTLAKLIMGIEKPTSGQTLRRWISRSVRALGSDTHSSSRRASRV